jgi:hypothetical protein
VAVILAGSWRPSRHAYDVSIIYDEVAPTPGTYVTRDVDYPTVRLLIVAAPSGKVSAFILPLRDGRVILPDLHWWRFGYLCADFRTETTDETITDSSIFECHDAELKGWPDNGWRWNIDGKTLSRRSWAHDDFTRVAWTERNGRVRIHRKDIRW